MSSESSYFCLSCQCHLHEEKEYKEHYKSEFHRYNIKRKLLEFAPVTFEQFMKQIMENKSMNVSQTSINKCDICKKSFNSKNTYLHHLQSKKHQNEELARANKNEEEKEEIIGENKQKSETITTLQDLKVCLFCNSKMESIPENLKHMQTAHSFFISEGKYLMDLEGLLKYLAEKVHLGLLCIYCDNQGTKGFKTGSAVQNHMIDKSHCFMNTEFFEEYEDFFDFSSQFEDLEKEDDLTRKLSEKKNVHYDIIKIEKDGKIDEEGGEWEDEHANEESKEAEPNKTGKRYRLFKWKILFF